MPDIVKKIGLLSMDVVSALFLAVALAGYVAGREREAHLMLSTFGETAVVLSGILSVILVALGLWIESSIGRWWHGFMAVSGLALAILLHAWLPGVGVQPKQVLPAAAPLNDEATRALIQRQVQQMQLPSPPVAESIEPPKP